MAQALEEFLIDKGLITSDSMRQGIEAMDAPSPARGAYLVARCWVDPAFEARVLQSTNEAAGELGFHLGETPIHAVKIRHRCIMSLCVPCVRVIPQGSWAKSLTGTNRVPIAHVLCASPVPSWRNSGPTSLPTWRYACTTARRNGAILSSLSVPKGQKG
jgi:Nitrile hydratase, alpha chain